MVREVFDKLERYIEMSSKAEEMMEDVAGEQFAKTTTESFKTHKAKLLDIKKQLDPSTCSCKVLKNSFNLHVCTASFSSVNTY